MFNADPNRTVDEILADIQRGAVSAASSGNINFVGHVLAPFAALLVKLSRPSCKHWRANDETPGQRFDRIAGIAGNGFIRIHATGFVFNESGPRGRK